MTTSIIDGALNASSFPTTYTGPGTLIGNARKMGDVSNHQWYNFTGNGNTIQINCGFLARKIRVINVTDSITWEWQYGMPAADSVKFVLGGSLAGTLDTGSAITVNDELAGNGYVTLSTTCAPSAKNICVEVIG